MSETDADRFGFDAARIAALVDSRDGNPFATLGPHRVGAAVVVRALLPGASAVSVVARDDGRPLGALARIDPAGLFAGALFDDAGYRLRIDWGGVIQETEDPYAFGALLPDALLHRLSSGDPQAVLDALGARPVVVDGVPGVRFAVWAPNASRVAVVGDFNTWDDRRHPMRLRHGSGVWELFIPHVAPGARYKYAMRAGDGGALPLKADPCARQAELPTATASIVADVDAIERFPWTDEAWIASRAARQAMRAPISIYEVHAGAWMRGPDGEWPDWDALAARLIPYACAMGFTHVEFMPLAEHPFGGSWGYQPLAPFAPTARLGTPDGFARFVDRAHAAGLGVIVDWVPAHFPDDAHGLARFDGTPLYEHADPREGWHPDWHTLVYNVGRHEVAAFLLASALAWLRFFHVDGLRVDAVASMLYRDYSRAEGEWVPNVHGGRENLESIAFLRQLDPTAHTLADLPGVLTIAEESTAWPGVTARADDGGLGFDLKWNMGWMHDTLAYLREDPVHRRYHHDRMTFGLVYAFSEHFVLPLSHDEVVHGKRALVAKMPGDRWQRFATLRAYYGFMWCHPGKKLLFMGGEFAQPDEFDHDRALHWALLDDPAHRGMQRLVRDLNLLYAAEPALHRLDGEPGGFEWLIGDDRDNSVFAFARHDGAGRTIVAICNFTPVPRERYRVGLPAGGGWIEALNTDGAAYGGSNAGNGGTVRADATPAHGRAYSAALLLPPLATLILRPEGNGRPCAG
ncbi:1,4-alpha-glucan branching protein GlgB [Burkholderia mayonis]|uniref:1,4-alpha-glucan branching enzyme GlgB n=1 Tax=Burkholderia mayonis TaxID=1385591 RepID=A0A1B4FWR5_9BURK|nr:1,4-alpha-glucan branching protein GlgB [Burkholderia mayonis]AOJ08118.1 glycogen-branching enzyme [Burkholderia mayonis]KVE59041.1 glycogen-branching enzyme [Burkholderia mayonis]